MLQSPTLSHLYILDDLIKRNNVWTDEGDLFSETMMMMFVVDASGDHIVMWKHTRVCILLWLCM